MRGKHEYNLNTSNQYRNLENFDALASGTRLLKLKANLGVLKK